MIWFLFISSIPFKSFTLTAHYLQLKLTYFLFLQNAKLFPPLETLHILFHLSEKLCFDSFRFCLLSTFSQPTHCLRQAFAYHIIKVDAPKKYILHIVM